jgi:hypothetical protein
VQVSSLKLVFLVWFGVVWFVCLFVGCLVGWLIGWLAGWLVIVCCQGILSFME